ncbi:MAG: butyrate kinase [bacterium]
MKIKVEGVGLILVINPGGGSTKIAVFDGETCVFNKSIPHAEPGGAFEEMLVQRDRLERAIADALAAEGIKVEALGAIVGRGGALKPMVSGTYRVNGLLAEDIRTGNVQAKHPSNLGALMAFELGERLGKPAFMVDPVSVDEFIPEARLTGLPELERKSLDHPLNSKMVARRAAREMGKTYEAINLIVVHMGTGISVSAHLRGRMIDVNNAQDGGPFSTQRTGGLPTTQLVALCYSGAHTRDELHARVTRKGGLSAHLGTDDMVEAEKRARAGDVKADAVLRAMAYQIAKEIGASAAALRGRVDAVVYTGGVAHCKYAVDLVREWVDFVTPNVFVYPGEHEMESLAQGALRVLRGEETAKEYR